MSVRLLPYIAFPGNGAEAMAYYHDVLGGSLDVLRYGDQQMDLPFDPPDDALAHGRLTNGDVRIAGGDDLREPDGRTLENDVHSFLLECDSVDEAGAIIGRFLETGASEEMPFGPAPWGDHYGQVKDRYGLLWAFVVEGGA